MSPGISRWLRETKRSNTTGIRESFADSRRIAELHESLEHTLSFIDHANTVLSNPNHHQRREPTFGTNVSRNATTRSTVTVPGTTSTYIYTGAGTY